MSSSPHDALFKAVFGQPEHARGALRSVLPAAVGEALDWRTLAPCSGSFIDPVLSGRHADLLFSVTWHGGGDALVYLLFEHQSTSDQRMAFRLLRYLIRIWERWLGEHPRADVLPIIVPVVLYHGTESWSAPVSFDALFEIPVAGPDAKDTIMTAGERLIQQGEERGIQKGIEQGVQQGIQQGVQQGERAMLLRLLRQRFGNQVDLDIDLRVASGSSAQVARWAERVLSAATLAELLAD